MVLLRAANENPRYGGVLDIASDRGTHNQSKSKNYSEKCICYRRALSRHFLVRVGPQKPLLATIKRQKLARFGHVTRHDSLSKTILQGNPGGWATPWSAEEMLDGKHQRVDIPAHARTANKGLLQKRLEEDLC